MQKISDLAGKAVDNINSWNTLCKFKVLHRGAILVGYTETKNKDGANNIVKIADEGGQEFGEFLLPDMPTTFLLSDVQWTGMNRIVTFSVCVHTRCFREHSGYFEHE